MKQSDRKNLLVTVITPAYNRADFLEESILSVLNQDYPNIEYIVLDDGSTDNTKEVIEKYKDRITFESHKNVGEVRTVNKGLKMAHGDIIGIVNSDDPLLPGAIREFVKFMQYNPEIIVAYSDWIFTDKNGKEMKRVKTRDFSYEYMIRSHNCPLGASAFFKKEILKKLKGRDVNYKYVSDYDFWLRAGLLGDFARIPKYLATSRVHPGQATIAGRSFRAAMDHIKVINKIFEDPKFPHELKQFKSEAYKKACEAARIARGNNLFTKIIISLICLYYSPIPYLGEFLKFHVKSFQKIGTS